MVVLIFISLITSKIKHIFNRMEFTFNMLLPSLVPTLKPCYFSFDRVSLLCSCLSILMSPTQSKSTSLLPYLPGLTWPPDPSLPFLQPILNIVYVTKASLSSDHSMRISEATSCPRMESSASFPGLPRRGPSLLFENPPILHLSPALFPSLTLANTAHAFQSSHFELLTKPFPSYSIGNL